MKTLTSLVLTASFTTGLALADTDNFDTAETGKPLPGWTVGVTGKGQANWLVERDESAPSKPQVLKQAGEATFAVALKDGTNLQDGVIEVKFKTLSGQQDQVGGLIWRARDTNNYYVVRAQALRGNLGFYKAVDGKRTALKKADGKDAVFPAKVQRGQWHTLRVEFTGKRCKATLDGKDSFEVEDDTFSSAGQVGVWTKADSVTVFDDFVFGSQ
jgi:hypothetical protein